MADTATTCPACGKGTGQSAGGGAATAPASSPALGMQENIAGALASFPLIGLIFLLIEPYNKHKFVRFCSFQAVAQGVCWIVGGIICGMIPIIGWFVLAPLFNLAMVLAMFICAFKHYSTGTNFKLPVIGDWAEKQA